MKTALFGFAIAALLLASAIAHALLGWPAIGTIANRRWGGALRK